MTSEMKLIGQRLRAQREIMEISVADMAQHLNMTIEEYERYERGEEDFAFSFLYNCAEHLGIDVLDLMTGDTPKLSICCVVRNGEGLSIERQKAYKYQHLAYTFRNKKAEPFMVTVAYNENAPLHLNTHDGQELDYVVEGELMIMLAGNEYVLSVGDSIYYDSGYPHAMKAVGGKDAKFLAVVMK